MFGHKAICKLPSENLSNNNFILALTVTIIIAIFFIEMSFQSPNRKYFFCCINEACIGYFGIRDIGLFLRDTGIFVFLFWDMGYSGILGYGILEIII